VQERTWRPRETRPVLSCARYFQAPATQGSQNSPIKRQNKTDILSAVTKLTLATKAAFIGKILCFEEFKILFGHLVDRMLENKSLQEHEAPPPGKHWKRGFLELGMRPIASEAAFIPHHSAGIQSSFATLSMTLLSICCFFPSV